MLHGCAEGGCVIRINNRSVGGISISNNAAYLIPLNKKGSSMMFNDNGTYINPESYPSVPPE
jgi:hypothetical protein